MIGHVGSKVSALVDGQLPPAEAERLWAHVHGCGSCRSEVEREGWVKTRLAGLALCAPPQEPDHLRGSLATVTAWPHAWPPGPAAPAGPHHPHAADRRRPVLLAALGAGSLSAALVGVLAVSVPANTPVADRRAPVASLTGPAETSRASTPRLTGVRESLPSGATLRNSSPIALLPQVGADMQKWVTITP